MVVRAFGTNLQLQVTTHISFEMLLAVRPVRSENSRDLETCMSWSGEFGGFFVWVVFCVVFVVVSDILLVHVEMREHSFVSCSVLFGSKILCFLNFLV